MLNVVLSLLMLIAIALLGGAFVIWRKTGMIRQAGLMVLLAAVVIVNILIWTLPDETGVAPAQKDLVIEE